MPLKKGHFKLNITYYNAYILHYFVQCLLTSSTTSNSSVCIFRAHRATHFQKKKKGGSRTKAKKRLVFRWFKNMQEKIYNNTFHFYQLDM